MNRLITNIRVISTDGGDFGYFMDREDLYSKLSGVKDSLGDNIEFIEIGDIIQLNEHSLKVRNINLKLEPINSDISHIQKTQNSTPSDFRIEVVITVDNMPLVI